MNFAPLLLGGLLVAGVVAAGDQHVCALAKFVHGQPAAAGHEGAADVAAGVAPLAVMHEALGRIGLADARAAQLLDQLSERSKAAHEALAALASAHDAQLAAVLAVPFDGAALAAAMRELAPAQGGFARSVVEMHGAIRAALTEPERQAFDTARDALLAEARGRHAELAKR
jgi:hypothetical protein